MLEIANGRRCRLHEIDASDLIFMMVSSRFFFLKKYHIMLYHVNQTPTKIECDDALRLDFAINQTPPN
jgi:hypothetical protein